MDKKNKVFCLTVSMLMLVVLLYCSALGPCFFYIAAKDRQVLGSAVFYQEY